MLKKNDCLMTIKNFKSKYGLEASDENAIATIHLMNTHGIDVHAALDQSSRSGNDHGIDAWHYDEPNRELFIYQSKLTESRAQTMQGFNDLDRARQWLEQVIIDGRVDTVPSDNHSLFNLYTRLSSFRETVMKIHFTLVSLFNKNELEDFPEYQDFERKLINAKLNEHARQNLKGKLVIDVVEFNLEQSVPEKVKVYPITKIPDARVDLRGNAHLDLSYVSLHSLVELYRQRGDVLFDKNVRLSLTSTKEARERLVNPMADTLDLITSGKLSPNIFPFYHIGVTIAASSSTSDDDNIVNLGAPSIINGCQTISIANEYLKKLEREMNENGIDLFKQIKVIAKVVVGTSNEELREITNANNRQNPIENWQLFSNEPIHIEIESILKDIGVFYERQKGKWDTMKDAANAKYYPATNGTYIRVTDLGQIIALSRKNLQWAAKPAEIFLNKENHDTIFDRSILNNPRDVVFVSNLHKAMKRGLTNYLKIPTHAESSAPTIFEKPIVRAHTYYLALLYFYQSDNRSHARVEYSTSLTKKASTKLVDEMESFYSKVVTKIKHWYTDESKSLTVDISKKRMDSFFADLAIQVGVDTAGAVPFSPRGIDWSKYCTQNP